MSQLSDGVITFSVKGVPIIGDIKNGKLFGLTNAGVQVVEKLLNDQEINTEKLDNNQRVLFESLKNNGFIEKYSTQSLPSKSAYIHINSRCNLHCKGCYSYVENRNNLSELRTDQWCNILKELVDSSFTRIIVSGGEPFLRNDLSIICKYAKQNGIQNLNIISNGTITFEKYDSVIPYLDSIAISVDGYNKDTSFIRDSGIMETVLKTIKYLKSRIKTSLIVTLHKKNINFMQNYQELADNLGVSMSYSIFSVDSERPGLSDYMFNEHDFVKIANTLISEHKSFSLANSPSEHLALTCRVGCGFGSTMLSISSLGDVYPCHMLQNEDCLMGNVLDTPLRDILNTPQFRKNAITVSDIKECNKCEYKFICGGGCRARSYLMNKNFKGKDPYCILAKTFYSDLFKSISHLPR